MMMLFYLAAGSNVPIISLYLTKSLDFSGAQTGAVLSMSALSAVVAPLIGTFIADRLVSSERLLAYAQFLSGILLFLLTFQERFLPVLLLYLFYQMVFQPGVAVTNAIVFHHSPNAPTQFGGIRKWGTMGWIFAGWFFSLLWLRFAGGDISDALYFSAGTSVLLGFYSLTLPSGSKDAPRRTRLFPEAALRVFRSPAILAVAGAGFFIQLVDKYYYFGTAPFLRDIGFADSLIMPIMSLGQMTEVVVLALLGGILARIGYRRALILGALMEVARFACFSLVGWKYLAVVGIAFHGPAFALFFSTAFIFIDSFTDRESRAGVQQLFNVVSIGLGNFAGSIVAGFVYDIAGRSGSTAPLVNYSLFWAVPLAISLGVALVLALAKRT